MKLTGELKAKVESAEGMEEKKALIADAGMELTDEELAAVAGGTCNFRNLREVKSPSAPVFRSSDDPHPIAYLSKGDTVRIIDGSETIGGNGAMKNYSPLIGIKKPVDGWIAKSAIK